jgi:hypothetical protein
MLIKLSKSEIRTIVLALYLASAWEDSLVDAKSKSNITKFQKLKSYLLQCINGLPLIR